MLTRVGCAQDSMAGLDWVIREDLRKWQFSRTLRVKRSKGREAGHSWENLQRLWARRESHVLKDQKGAGAECEAGTGVGGEFGMVVRAQKPGLHSRCYGKPFGMFWALEAGYLINRRLFLLGGE